MARSRSTPDTASDSTTEETVSDDTTASEEAAAEENGDEKEELPKLQTQVYSQVAQDSNLFQTRGYVAASEIGEGFKHGSKKYEEGGVIVSPDETFTRLHNLKVPKKDDDDTSPAEGEPFVLSHEDFHNQFVSTPPAKHIA